MILKLIGGRGKADRRSSKGSGRLADRSRLGASFAGQLMAFKRGLEGTCARVPKRSVKRVGVERAATPPPCSSSFVDSRRHHAVIAAPHTPPPREWMRWRHPCAVAVTQENGTSLQDAFLPAPGCAPSAGSTFGPERASRSQPLAAGWDKIRSGHPGTAAIGPMPPGFSEPQ